MLAIDMRRIRAEQPRATGALARDLAERQIGDRVDRQVGPRQAHSSAPRSSVTWRATSQTAENIGGS